MPSSPGARWMSKLMISRVTTVRSSIKASCLPMQPKGPVSELNWKGEKRLGLNKTMIGVVRSKQRNHIPREKGVNAFRLLTSSGREYHRSGINSLG